MEHHWGMRYTPSGMIAVLHWLGYLHKKEKLEPGQHLQPEVEEAFVEKY